MNDCKKPGVAFWASVTVVMVLVGYPLSFGRACWISSRTNVGASAVSIIYRPMMRAMSANASSDNILCRYGNCLAASGWEWARMRSNGDYDPISGEWTWMDQGIVF